MGLPYTIGGFLSAAGTGTMAAAVRGTRFLGFVVVVAVCALGHNDAPGKMAQSRPAAKVAGEYAMPCASGPPISRIAVVSTISLFQTSLVAGKSVCDCRPRYPGRSVTVLSDNRSSDGCSRRDRRARAAALFARPGFVRR